MFSRIVKKFKSKKSEKILNSLLSKEKISELESRIGCKINNRQLFIQALIHRSYLEESKNPIIPNERLEFLGDAVLSLLVADYLYIHFPENDEGFLTKVRARIVNRKVLADAAEALKLEDYIIVGKNLFKNGSRSVLSDAFEAIVGAIYLDSGIEETIRFVNKILIKPITNKDDFLKDENYKSQLLEFAQSRRMENPSYLIAGEEGPQHNRMFTIKVLINGIEYGTGKGRNKKSAEQDAAKAAMIKLLQEN